MSLSKFNILFGKVNSFFLFLKYLIPELSSHPLRFSYASHLVMVGVPLYVVKELLGHSSIKTTEIYAHLAEKYKTDMAAKLPY